MVLHVELVSPERTVFSGGADMVIARTVSGGDIAFMDGHAPFLGALEVATATISNAGQEEQVAVHGGFVEVTVEPGGPETAGEGMARVPGRTVVTILSDIAELSSEIDINRAQRAKERAEDKLRAERSAEAEAALRRAHVRLAAAGS